MNFFAIFLLGLAVSIDAFVVGLTYGLRNIRVKLGSLILITLITVFALSISMSLGSLLANFMTIETANIIGASILIFIGFKALYDNSLNRNNRVTSLIYLKIKPLGIIINVLKEPVRADTDVSGDISYKESSVLGIALALDALGAGFGAGAAGFNIYLTCSVTGILTFIGIYTGVAAGKLFNISKYNKLIQKLPGIILILIGITRILG